MIEQDDFFVLDLENVKVNEFGNCVMKYFIEKELVSRRTEFLEDIFKGMMRITPASAGRMQWWTFKQLFSQSKNYLAKKNVFIQGRYVDTFTKVPTSTKRVKKVGYSISKKDTDYLKNNEVLAEMEAMINKGIRNNQERADALRKQTPLSDFIKQRWYAKESGESESGR